MFAEVGFELFQSPPFRQRNEDYFRPPVSPHDNRDAGFGDVTPGHIGQKNFEAGDGTTISCPE